MLQRSLGCPHLPRHRSQRPHLPRQKSPVRRSPPSPQRHRRSLRHHSLDRNRRHHNLGRSLRHSLGHSLRLRFHRLLANQSLKTSTNGEN